MHGIVNIDKPLDLTSHDVVVQVRRMSRQHQVGHAGTLDPLATGVLLVCLGQATRVSEYLMGSPKTYRAAIHLGVSTTTHDAEGEIVAQSPVETTRAGFEQALGLFVGRIEQVPPMHSAIKQKGRKLYKLAHRGITVERAPRPVEIFALALLDWMPPIARVEVRCGPGTYIRALARDLGQALGCGAHLSGLRRTQSGQFSADNAVSIERLEAAFAESSFDRWLHGIDAAFADLPEIHLDGPTAYRLALGQFIDAPSSHPTETRARAYGPERRFIALIERTQPEQGWKPVKVFVSPDEMAPNVD
ncbi:MAG: tRNA pseudouridine(55) synthase TruB [Anaerolineae bacterium]|nr:tRNA pseudouridine(55) synthase TruB [Anaerolineae bacterium]